MRKKTKQLGQILIEQGLISDEQLSEALKVQERVPKSLGRILIDRVPSVTEVNASADAPVLEEDLISHHGGIDLPGHLMPSPGSA